MPLHLQAITNDKMSGYTADLLLMAKDNPDELYVSESKYILSRFVIVDELSGDPFGKITITMRNEDERKSLQIIDIDITLDNEHRTEVQFLELRRGSSDANEYYDAMTVAEETHFELETVCRHIVSDVLVDNSRDVSISAFPFRLVLLITKVIIPNSNYKKAKSLLDAERYEEAVSAFQALGSYKDSKDYLLEAKKAKEDADQKALAAQIEAKNAAAYEEAMALLSSGDYTGAINAFALLGNYKDSAKKLEEARKAKKEAENDAAYKNAVALRDAKDYDAAIAAFSALGDYKDSTEQANEAKYLLAKSLLSYGKNVNYDNIAKSRDLFIELGNYKDSKEYLQHFSLKIIAEFSQTNLVFYNEYGDRLFEGYNAKSQNGNLIIDCDSYTFTYDENGRLVKYDRHWKNAPDDTVYFNYKFSSDGRISIVQTREKKSKPWKTAMKYRYDNQGRVSTVEFFREQYIDPKMQLIRSKAEYEYDGKKLVSIKYYGYYNGWTEYHSYTDTEIKFEYDSNGKLVYLIYKNSPANNNNVSGQSYYYGYVYAPKARDLFMPIESPISLVPFYY